LDEFDIDSGGSLVALLLLPLQRFPTYAQVLDHLGGGHTDAGVRSILGQIKDIAAAHLFSFHQRFLFAGQTILALPCNLSPEGLGDVPPPLRVRISSAPAQIVGIPVAVTLHLFSDILVWSAQNPSLGGEALLGVLPLAKCRVEMGSDSNLQICNIDTQQVLLQIAGPTSKVIAFWLIQAAVALALMPALDFEMPVMVSMPPLSPEIAARYERIRKTMEKKLRDGWVTIELKLECAYSEFKKDESAVTVAEQLGVELKFITVVGIHKEGNRVCFRVSVQADDVGLLVEKAKEMVTLGVYKILEPPMVKISTDHTSQAFGEHATESTSDLEGGSVVAGGEVGVSRWQLWSNKILDAFGKRSEDGLSREEFGFLLKSYSNNITQAQVTQSFEKYASEQQKLSLSVLEAWLKDNFEGISEADFKAGMDKVLSATRGGVRSVMASVKLQKGDEGARMRRDAHMQVLEAAISAKMAAVALGKAKSESEISQCKQVLEASDKYLLECETKERECSAQGAEYLDAWLTLCKNTPMLGAYRAKQIALEADLVSELSGALGVRSARMRVLSFHPHSLAIQIRISSVDGEVELSQIAETIQRQALDKNSLLRRGGILSTEATKSIIVFGGYQAIEENMPRLGSTPRQPVEPAQVQVMSEVKHESLQVMYDPIALKHFMHYVSATNNAGPPLFFQRVQEYRVAPSDGMREAMYDGTLMVLHFI